MKRVSEPRSGLEMVPFPGVVADHKSRWWKGQSCLCQQQDGHSAVPFLVFLVLFLAFPSFLSRVSSNSQNKVFGRFVASFLHPQPPVGSSNSKPQHWELGTPPQILVLAQTMQHHALKLLHTGRKETFLPPTPWTQGIHIAAALALMPNLLTLRTCLLHLRHTGQLDLTFSQAPALCYKNCPFGTVEDLDEHCRLDKTCDLHPLKHASIMDPTLYLRSWSVICPALLYKSFWYIIKINKV